MLAVFAAVGLVGCTDRPAPGPSVSPPVTPLSTPPPSTPPSRSTTPAPADPLTGRRVSTGPVVAVKIDNTSAARPQLGLDDADHVWVQEVEAGITRLVAVFHTTLPDRVGPVRSARSTDVELLGLYGSPLLVYSGANGDVTRQLRTSASPTASGGKGFRRVSGRAAPYDLMADLTGLTAGRRLARPAALGLQFAVDDPDWAAAKKVDAATVTVGSGRQRFTWSGGHYRVEPNDTTTDNVVILSVDNVADGNADVNGARSVKSRTVGSGRAVVLRGGRTRTGTWTRRTADGALTLSADGRPIRLTPGRTWFLLKG